MLSRRQLVKSGCATFSVGVLARATRAFAAPRKLIYGVQIYELREQAKTDLAGAFDVIRRAGFSQVELYPIAYSHTPAELRKMLAAAGLGCISGHFDYGSADKVSYARDLGLQYVVCPWIDEPQRTVDGYKKTADDFTAWGEKVRAAGMTFCFHNHCYEFKPIGGSNGFTLIMDRTDPSVVKLEADIFWLEQGGQDSAAFLSQYANRIELVHIKDRRKGSSSGYSVDTGTANIVDVGRGEIKWRKLLEEARTQGVRYAYVDQDETPNSTPEKSLAAAHAYLEKLDV